MKTKLLQQKTLIAGSIASALALTATSSVATTSVWENDSLLVSNAQHKLAQVEQTRYIIKFKGYDSLSLMESGEEYSAQQAEARKVSNEKHLMQTYGVETIFYLNRSNAAVALLSDAQLSALKGDSNVEYVELDPERRQIQTITRTFEGLNPAVVTPSAETSPYGIALVQANQVSDSQTGNMNVCITDTGYDGTHEDLRPYTDSGITGSDNDGLGNDTGNWWTPGHSHGTHVAGTIAALGGNGKGVVGVNPSGLLDLHNVKVFNDAGNWGYGSDLVKAIEQCRNAGSKVISMSLGGGQSSTTEENAFIAATNAGLINIAAAGNDGNSSMSYPASYNSVMSVGALDSSKNHANFSQYNSQVEIAAPGVSVTSTTNGSGYATWDGTSMATPHVAGVAALVWSHFPSCTGNQIRNAINVTAEDLGSPGRDNYYGYGLVQAKAMYDAIAANGCDLDDPIDPDPIDGVLENGVAQNNISGAQGSQQNWTMAVPAGATNVNVAMSGGTGDADLYVKFGSPATKSNYDCRPYASGNNESCAGNSDNGTYHVMIDGYSAFSGVSLVGSFDAASNGDSYTNNNNVTISDNATVESNINVTGSGDSGSILVTVDIKHTWVGDLKLTIFAPNGASAVLREYTGGSADNIYATYSLNATGVERNGQWRLQVTDNAGGDTGYIDSWTIDF